MIESLELGDVVVFKDGDEGVINQAVQGYDIDRGVNYIDYCLDVGFYIRYTPSRPEDNRFIEDQIAKVIKHDQTRGNKQG